MLKLKLQDFGHLMQRVGSLEKTLMVGGTWGRRRRGRQRRWLDGSLTGWCVFEWTLGVGDGQGGLVCCKSWGRKQSDTTEWLNWTELSVCCTVKWLNYRHLYTHFKILFSIMVYYRILSIVPCYTLWPCCSFTLYLIAYIAAAATNPSSHLLFKFFN